MTECDKLYHFVFSNTGLKTAFFRCSKKKGKHFRPVAYLEHVEYLKTSFVSASVSFLILILTIQININFVEKTYMRSKNYRLREQICLFCFVLCCCFHQNTFLKLVFDLWPTFKGKVEIETRCTWPISLLSVWTQLYTFKTRLKSKQ